MTAVRTDRDQPVGPRPSRPSRPPLMVVGAAAALAILVGVFAYRAGLHAGRTVTVRSGIAYSSGAQASVTADDWTYSVPLGAGSVWYGAGSEHQGSTPACLPPDRHVRITFGTLSYYRDGALNRTVVWVRC